MKKLYFIAFLATISFNCQKELSPEPILSSIPTVTTTTATSITNTTAASGGNITDDGGEPITVRGVCWSTSPNPVLAGNHTTDGSGAGAFASNITGLTAMTVYYARAYATNSVGTAYGNEITFTTTNTSTALPTITTATTIAITMTTATSGGNVTNDGGATITARGVCWATTANPTIALSTKTSDGTGTGIFTSAISGLTAATIYHVRAYATNSIGTSYGGDSTFTTAATITIPTITTTAVTAITNTTATSGGTITMDGGAPVTARGVCWSTTANPTIALPTKTTDGTGIGTFTSAITGLTASTLYHVRAYATNSVGTSYGNDVNFTTTASIPADVYVAGYENAPGNKTNAKYWANGTPTVVGVSDPYAYGNDIFVSGSDVYVAGNEFFSNGVNFYWKAMVWKNGVATTLAQTATGGGQAIANSVFVSGSDVYVAGYVLNTAGTGAIAKLWKNGVATDLTTGTTIAKTYCVFVSGTDVYVAGMEFTPAGEKIAKYWKNGVATSLTLTGFAEAQSIFVSGTDVYVAGFEQVGTYDNARLWKNGVSVPLPINAAFASTANDLVVSGSDVYVTGLEYSGTTTSTCAAKLWKNGVASALPALTPSIGNGIAIKGSDVYVSGQEYNGSIYIAKLWKNGVPISLSPGTTGSVATGIFVK